MALNKLTTKHLADNTIKSAKIADGAITDAKISESTTISLSKTAVTGTQPTISSLSISQKSPGSAANVTITGTNFVSIPQVKFINQSTGARITASTVTYTSSTTLTVSFPADQPIASYKVYVENPGGLAVQSTAQIINSDAPNWQTDAALGSYEEGDSVNVQLLAYDDDSTAVTGYTLQSGSLPSGITLSGDSTIGSLTGTAPTVSADTAYNFTIRATDNESQTTDKAFSLTVADYNIGNTAMFNSGDGDYLNRTPSSAGNRRTYTFSWWMKVGAIGTDRQIMQLRVDANNRFNISLAAEDTIAFQDVSGGTRYGHRTNALFRDPSAWYHFVVSVDTTQATDSNRYKIYANGSEQSLTALVAGYTPQNHETLLNSTNEHFIGKVADGSADLNGYIGEFIFIDGTALTPTSFGELNSDGVWIPKKYTGSYGTNGYLLEFDSSGSLGTDTSGNSNNWTVNNLTAIDQVIDTPHNNFCTMNPLITRSGTAATYSEGNLKVVWSHSVNVPTMGTLGVQSGKWYYESKMFWGSNSYIGITYDSTPTNTDVTGYLLRQTGQKYDAFTGSGSSYTSALSSGDTVMIAFDADNGTLWFGVNGTWSNGATQTEIENGTTTNAAFSSIDMSYIWLPMGKGGISSNARIEANFGNPIYTISSGNSDGNGYGNFEYTVPNGYYSWNTKNLAEYG